MRGTVAKRLRRKVWGARKDWDFEVGLHPRLRSYVISSMQLTHVPRFVEGEEGDEGVIKTSDGKFAVFKMVEFEYFGPIFEADRREYRKLKRRHRGC